ncbi:MAG: hypothetical protein ACI93R_003747 [Flavobacteriales bacterium]|jgi:hypothetical protein
MKHDVFMTAHETACFKAARKWQRYYLRQKLVSDLLPKPLFTSREITRPFRWFMNILFIPVSLVIWLAVLLFNLAALPFRTGYTFLTPSGMKPPGERNIQGMHYNFSRYAELPPELHVRCINDWVALLYGTEKLTTNSFDRYLDLDNLLRKEILNSKDSGVREYLHQQLNHARHELSQDLGHYR